MSQTMQPPRTAFRPATVAPRPAAAPASATAAAAGLTREEILARVEEARGRHQNMRDAGIRWEADVERFSREEAEARKAADAAYGTNDPEELRALGRAEVAAAVAIADAYVQKISDVAERVNAIQVGSQA